MSTSRTIWAALSLFLCLASLPRAACAAEIKVLSAGAFKAVIEAMAADFQKATGHTLKMQGDTAGGLVKRVAAGEPFDVVIAPPAALAQMTGGQIAPNHRQLARVGVGVAVKDGNPVPDISTVEAFKATIMAAKSVAYIDPAAGGTSGIYVHKMLETLGLADIVKPKAILVSGGLVAAKVASGEADIALHQISEILPVPGVKLVGPLPGDLQVYTVYAMALASKMQNKAAVDALAAALVGAESTAAIDAKGMEKMMTMD